MSYIQTLNPKPQFPFIFSPINPRPKPQTLISATSNPNPNPNPNQNPKPKSKARKKTKTNNTHEEINNPNKDFPTTIPQKPRRGRRSEAAAVEDFVRNSLEKTFESIRKQNSEVLDGKDKILKDKIDEIDDDAAKGKRKEKEKKKGKMVVEEEDPNWPLDAEVGWGIRASEYFEEHAIRNVVGEDGVEIDWEGEMDDNYVKEINCLEWESFAFHPSPLIVLVFERYTRYAYHLSSRATDNWKVLKELEKAIKVYWDAKDKLPPRTVKLDINIERDLAYALKVREGPELLFLRGNRILYREKEIRTADELIHMIAHFYYNAKRPSCINPEFLAPY
ncbi:hypothetical protein Sjap_006062 [Stephania japonica]|uniref:Uncharacterized protein n=1 Tax=Stephania japonica TaxID=461633 RepID=A0AAP0K6R6_9MAGN